jgi:hypothetical protein
MKVNPTLFSMQVGVPHSEYGNHTYFIATPLRDWIVAHGLDNRYCGHGSWGDGTTNGITNHESVYMIDNIQEIDALAFQIMFPKCRVHVCKQYEYRG